MKVVETYDGSGCSKHLGNGFMKSQSFSFSPMPLDFIRPPPAPVFNPTPEEFTDPISYVQRISSIAFNYGICKIRPPNGWKPPFCVDQQNFTFVPRVQELSDVCAYNRVRYHFITSLINFWEAQDVTLFVPQIKGRSIDIYRLWKQVQSTGGYQTVCEKKLWCKICGEIGLPAVPSFASSLSSHYKKYLLPYDTFISDESVNDNEHLEFSCSSQSRKNKPPVEKMVCSVCNLGNDDKYLLLCDGCETYGACHTYCLDPPLSDVPKGNWYCRSCIIRRYKRLNRHEVFGFKSSNVKYTLHTFGIRADDFKAKHFGKPTHMVSLEEAEAEFWRLVGSEDTGVSVEYGADLNAREHGSGFPTSRQGRTSQKSKNYVTSPWNLNNTPLLDNSALRFLPRNISGMIIPWCYVGMAFSCFCWHTEDHWSYSINYLHMGEPKTWYGVPTNYADAFELAMRSEVPELFVNSPDLLHHMTTMVSPSRLQAHGVPVYRTDQMVGEFVVTFPRAFHAGFNQGFNFAEAVNFCPADWLEYGRNCIEHYALLHRTPVFSHAELLCRMAKSVEPLSVEFLTVITKQLGDLLTTERSLRRHLARIGVRLTERMVFENSEDEKRECDLCRTTLYLSSLGCKCSESMVCLAHYQIRTCCPRDSQIMRYRYDLDELTEFKEKLQSKLIEFEQWKNQIENEVFSAMQNPVDTVKLSSALKTATTTNTTTEINHNKSGNNLEQQTDLLKLNNYLKLSICDNVDNSVNNSSIVSSNNTKENDREDIIVDTKLDTDNKNELATVDSKPSSSISLKIDPEQHQKLTLFDLNKLLKLGRSRQYPNTLVERLNYVVHTISECSSVVRKLITSYKNACESMKITQETEMKSLKSESTDSGHEEEDDDHDFENDDDADNDNGASERKEELKQNTNQTVHNILHTSTSSRSSSETDDEVSIEDSRNSTATSFTKNSRRLSSSFHGDDDDNDDYTERLEQREEDKTEVTNQNEQVNVSLRANYRNNNSDNSNNNNNSCRKLRSRSTSCHYASSNRTRNKSSASKGPFISKLTLNEFASLVKLASTLPVILPEYKDLQELADHITRWRSEVRDLLVNLNKKPFLNNNNNGNDNVNVNDDCIISSSISDINTTTNDSSSLCDLFKIELQLRSVLPSVIKVAEYINVGSAIDIELPELNQLKRVHECLTWLEKVDKALNYKSNSVHEKIEKNITITSKPTLSNLCDLQIQGSHVASAIAYVMNIPENAYSSYNFSSHSLLDTVLSIQSRHLLETISTVKLVEEKLNEIIQAKPGSLSLNSVKEQLIIAKQLPIQLTAITNVQLICEKAEKYEKQFELFAKLLLQNVSLSPSSLNEYNRNTFKQEQCCYTEGRQNKKEEEANTADNNGINQCTMDQEILDEVGLGSVNSTPINWQSYFNTLEDNIQDCVIKFPQNDSIRKLLSDLNKFHEKLSKLFIRPQSTRSLLEILLPRSASALEWLIRLDGDPDIIPDSYRNNFNLDANNCPPTTYKRHTRSPHFQSLTYKSLCKDHVQEFAKISNVSDWEQMYNSTYNRFVEAEVSLMHYLRSTNMRKSRAKNQEKIVYCICRQPGLTSFMLQCELCRDWVHGRCVTLPALKDSETERMRYICPRCECSLRPDLKQVFNFVSELNNLFSCNNDSNHDQTVNSNDNQHERSLCFHQFPEFVAVQLLCYRAISFIKHIQKSIASNTELKQALSDYEHFSNMTMPSINLIEENISEELMSSSNCNDTSQIPTNSKKIYLPTKGTSPLDLASSSKSSLGSDRRSSNTTVRSIISHSQDYLDTDFAKTQTLGSYLPTSRPRAGNISMPAKSPWKVMNSTMSKLLIQRQEQRFRKSQMEFIDKLHAKLLNHPCFGGATEVDALISKLRTELEIDCRTNEYASESLYESVKSSNLSETLAVTYDQPSSPVLSVSEACPIRGSSPTNPETKRANNESSSSQKDNILLSAHKIAAVPAHEETGNKPNRIGNTVAPNQTSHDAKSFSNESIDQGYLIVLPDPDYFADSYVTVQISYKNGRKISDALNDNQESNTTFIDTDYPNDSLFTNEVPSKFKETASQESNAGDLKSIVVDPHDPMEMSANRNPREFIIPDEMRSSSSSSRLSNLELQFSSYKQGFKSQSLGSDSTVCTHSGELKETEAAEALAGLSASLNSQSSIVQKQDLSLSSVYNRHSYSNFKTDISFGQLGSRSNLSGKIMNQRDVGFSPCSTDRSDSMHFNKLHHGPLLSPNHIRDLCNVNRLGQSKIPTTDLETTRKTSCLQSTRKFYFPLSAEARKILENLIMEACLLEVHLPQTRWLWQLHLASDQETESCGAYHPFVAKIEEERLKRRILRHIQQSNQSKLSERFRAGRRKRRGSGSVGNFVNVLNKNMEHSDDSNISLTENSELQKRQRHSPIYSEAEEKQSGSSSVSDPITHPTLIPRRKAYRLRGRASDLTIARRYKMGRPRRLLPVRSRRSVQRPSHAIGYRSMRSTEQKHFYNPTMRNVLQQECHTMLSNSKQCKMPTNRRARNLSGQLCMASRRTGRVYRGERLVRRLHAFSNNEYSDSSTSEEHLETTPTNEQYHSRHGSIPYRKMTSGYFSYSVGRKRSAFRHARLSGIRSTMAATKTMLNNDESEDENVDCATDDQASNYEDDECPAGPCLHPQTGTVKWVQCEACCRWYHQICVGIHHHFQLPKVYFCPTCHQRATHGLTVRRKQLPTVKNFSRLPSERFPDKHPSKLHLRTKATAGSPLKLGSHLSRRPVGWTTKSAVLSPRLPKLRPYNGPEVSNVLDDDYDDDNDKSNNNTTEEKDVNSTLNQDIPVLTSQLVVDNWCDISQSSEEPSIKIPVSSPRESVHMDEPPVIDAYEHVPNNYTNDEDAVEVSKGPTEVLLEALDVMSSENHFK